VSQRLRRDRELRVRQLPMLSRFLSAAVVGIAGALVLTGCETGAGYGVAALSQASGGSIRVAMCAPTDANRLSFSIRHLTTSKDWTVVAEYEGKHTFTRGEEIELGEPISGMRLTQTAHPPVHSGQEYALVIDGRPERTVYWSAVDWNNVGTDWLHVNHSANLPAVTTQACPGT